MKKKIKYFLTLLWFSYLMVTSILLFSKGFLLTREVQDQNSTCTFSNLDFCHKNGSVNNCEVVRRVLHNFPERMCQSTSKKVILLIIDALRYDFTVYNEKNLHPLFYENKLPIIKEILDSNSQSSRLYKFMADPPTTTMQRLKALTTGSLPTFIDAGSNFASSEINEDNIIDQVVKNHGKVVFMGDDTWSSLFPKRFTRNYPYPSFNVWDLDTVDNGVKSHLFPELNQTDWKFLIGHLLGVDHCGHRYGPNHPEMERKLTEINSLIEEVVKSMDNESILFVIGDHGMTATGDHGGESMDEIQAAMFVYSKQPLSSTDITKKSVKQVDLVPTLSAILGVPVPFQNLGILIQNALPETQCWCSSLFSLWNNVHQILTYIKTYSENSRTFDPDYLKLYFTEFDSLSEEMVSLNTFEKYEDFSRRVTDFLVKIRILCEEVWIQFDAFSISNGLTFFFLTIFFSFIISDGIHLKHLPFAIEGSFTIVCLISLLFSIFAVAVLSFSNLLSDFLYTSIFVANVISHLAFLLPIFQNWDVISLNWYTRKKTYGIINLICRFILILNVSAMFSNSFINEESSVLLFLLVSAVTLALLGVLVYYKPDQNLKKTDFISYSTMIRLLLLIIGVLVLLRLSTPFWRCRVEQEWCLNDVAKKATSKFNWTISVFSLVFLTILMKAWLKKCGNLSDFSYSVQEVIAKVFPSVIIVFVAGFWAFNNHLVGVKQPNTSSYLALAVYVLTGLSLTILITRPICVNVILNVNNAVVNIFNKLKGNEDQGNVPIVCGLGTVYSAFYSILGTFLTILIGLLLGDTFTFPLFIMAIVATAFLMITSILRIKMANSLEELFNVPTLVVLGWILLPQYFFFATGHQPAFPNIAWESAFVGTSGLFSNNYILGALVISNTFGTYLLAGILLPLLVIAPFTLLVMMPSACGKNKSFYVHCQKGEMNLFERDRMANGAVFVVCCKYIAGHAIKVFTAMLAATIHCRHLMVWSIFAPKFIFEALALFVTIASVLAGYLLYLKISVEIERFVSKLNKLN